jgi:hypothetical protein
LVIAPGTRGRFAPKALALGPMGCHARGSSGFMWSSPSHGRLADALRPACAIWMPATAPCCFRKATTRGHFSAWRSFHRPVQPGVIRPSGETAVASATIRPAPPMACDPR